MKLYHGESEIDVHPSDVARLVKQGWSKKAPPKQNKQKTGEVKSNGN